MFSGPTGLLEEQQPDLLQPPPQADGRAGGVARAQIGGDVHLVSHRPAAAAHVVQGLHFITQGDGDRNLDALAPARPPAGKVGLDGSATLLRQTDAALGLVGVAVEPHAVAAGAAQEVVDGAAEGLSHDVPQRDFDAAYGGYHRPGLADLVQGVIHAVVEVLDVKGVLSDHQAAELLDGPGDDPTSGPVGRVSHPHQAFVGEHLQQNPR